MGVRAFAIMLFCFVAFATIISLLTLPKPTGVEHLDAMKNAQTKDLHTVYIQTIKYDGHMFVSAQTITASGGASITHHPDCQCMRPKER